MKTINSLKIKLASVQQSGMELLLEHYLRCLTGGQITDTLCHLLLAELLLKVKQKNILEQKQATYTLKPHTVIALMAALNDCPLPQHPLALSVHTYLHLTVGRLAQCDY
jgi:hypothetical protein